MRWKNKSSEIDNMKLDKKNDRVVTIRLATCHATCLLITYYKQNEVD